jgi:hypothetical protein
VIDSPTASPHLLYVGATTVDTLIVWATFLAGEESNLSLVTLQNLVILISVSVKHALGLGEARPGWRADLVGLLGTLPRKIAFRLFFSLLDYFLVSEKPSLLVGFLQTPREFPDSLIAFAFQELDQSVALGSIPVSAVRELIQATSQPAIAPRFQSLFLIHQRALALHTLRYLETAPWAFVRLTGRLESAATPVDLFYEYGQFVFNAVTSLPKSQDLECSFFLVLFSNFVRLLSAFVSFHALAQILVPQMASLLADVSVDIQRAGPGTAK